MLGHVFSYNVLRRKIYPTLPEPRTYVHYRFSIISAQPAGLPNRRDHGSLSRNRPRLSVNSLYLLKKKHFYSWCAGLLVHALLTIYIADFIYTDHIPEGLAQQVDNVVDRLPKVSITFIYI